MKRGKIFNRFPISIKIITFLHYIISFYICIYFHLIFLFHTVHLVRDYHQHYILMHTTLLHTETIAYTQSESLSFLLCFSFSFWPFELAFENVENNEINNRRNGKYKIKERFKSHLKEYIWNANVYVCNVGFCFCIHSHCYTDSFLITFP